ncbi:MAG: YbbR-like protein YbbR [Bacillales bacterium]|jgi:YbbR domain-containing protein|nr:YbbR-like protein YbbR [Bacillales bacterium]
MDKLLDNKWVMRIIALLLAVMLYMSVSLEDQTRKPSENFFSVTSDKEIIEEIPLQLYYDTENLVISGYPKTVSVELEGPNSIMKTTKLQKNFTIYADLRNLELGAQRVPLRIENLSDKLTVKITPAEIFINIQEKITKDFPIEVDFINRSKMEPGYSISGYEIKPSKAILTGAKRDIDKVAIVKAFVNVSGVNESFEQEAKVYSYDANGNRLNVEIKPDKVNVKVDVKSPSKTVPIELQVTRGLGDDYSLTKLAPLTTEVKIFSKKQSILDVIDSLKDIPVDLGDVKENSILEIKIPRIPGIDRIEPSSIKVKVEIEKKVKKTFEGITVKANNIPSELDFEFIEPKEGKVDVTISGAPSILKNITQNDISAFINITENEPGTFTAVLELDAPKFITVTASTTRISYELKNKSS